MDRESVLRQQQAESTEKKLRTERAALKRALLTERETVTALKEEVQRRDAESRSLLARVDEITSEKNRLAAVANQLKQELALEKQSSSMNLTGGSMFNTLLSSADGSAAEIQRLENQIKLTEEQLQSHIRSTGKLQDDMHKQRRMHQAEREKLEMQVEQARQEVESQTEKLEAATSELQLVERERSELRTQLDAKVALVDELSRKLKNKSQQLQYVQHLREEDIATWRAKFESKVPFDDTSNPQVFPSMRILPRTVVLFQKRCELEDACLDHLKRLSSCWFSFLADCKSAGVQNKLCTTSITPVCTALQSLVGSAQQFRDIGRLCKPKHSFSTNNQDAYSRLRSEFEATVRAYVDFVDHIRDQQEPLGKVLGTAFTPTAASMSALRRSLVSDPVKLDDTASQCSTIASHFRNALASTQPEEEFLRTCAQVHSEVFSAVAMLLQEYLIAVRSVKADSVSRRKARGYLARINSRLRISSHSQSVGGGLQQRVVDLQEQFAAQGDRLRKVETQYQQARASLTAKEKALGDLEARLASADSTFVQSPSIQLSSENVDGVASLGGGTVFDSVIVNTRDKDLVESLHEVLAQSERSVQPTDDLADDSDPLRAFPFAGKLDEFSNRIQQAELLASDLAIQLEHSKAVQERLQQEKARLQTEGARLEGLVKQMKSSTAEELALTRANYDSQLQQLTQHVMRLQDELHEKELHTAKLEAQLKPTSSTNPF